MIPMEMKYRENMMEFIMKELFLYKVIVSYKEKIMEFIMKELFP